MNQSEKNHKKSKKPFSSSRRAAGATATTSPSTRTPAGGPGGASAGSGAPASSPGGGGRTGMNPTHGFWPATSLGGSFAVDSTSPNSSEWLFPPGGFVKSLQMPQTNHPQPYPFVNYPGGSHIPQNFYFVGAPNSRGTPSPTESVAVDAAGPDTQEEETIDIDDDDNLEHSRTEKRLNWSHEEDIRLASAWLHNSLDPVDGNGKKSDKYWADVTATYNSTTPSNRRRNRNQLKIRWDRTKKPVSEFHGCWVRATRVFQSGVSDDQRTDQALQMYASEHGDKPFLLQHIWRVVRHERKWAAYVQNLNKEKNSNAALNPANVVCRRFSKKTSNWM